MHDPGEDDLPDFTPPITPLCPIPPNAYLRWLWRAVGAKGEPDTLATYALNWQLTFREARTLLVGQAKWTRRFQHEMRRLPPGSRYWRQGGHTYVVEGRP